MYYILIPSYISILFSHNIILGHGDLVEEVIEVMGIWIKVEKRNNKDFEYNMINNDLMIT